MHFFASFVLLLLAELVSADKLEWSGVGPGATACKKTYLNSDVTYVFALFVTVSSPCHVVALFVSSYYKPQRLILYSIHAMDKHKAG